MTLRLLLAAMAAAALVCAQTACEHTSPTDSGGSGSGSNSNGGGSASDNSSVHGNWTVTNWDGDASSGLYFHFNSDGSFSLNNSPSTHGHRTGTYSVNGNQISGNGENPGVGAFDISFTISGGLFTGEFIERWHTPNKRVAVSASKQ